MLPLRIQGNERFLGLHGDYQEHLGGHSRGSIECATQFPLPAQVALGIKGIEVAALAEEDDVFAKGDRSPLPPAR
jgi:hypothetical protein